MQRGQTSEAKEEAIADHLSSSASNNKTEARLDRSKWGESCVVLKFIVWGFFFIPGTDSSVYKPPIATSSRTASSSPASLEVLDQKTGC